MSEARVDLGTTCTCKRGGHVTDRAAVERLVFYEVRPNDGIIILEPSVALAPGGLRSAPCSMLKPST